MCFIPGYLYIYVLYCVVLYRIWMTSFIFLPLNLCLLSFKLEFLQDIFDRFLLVYVQVVYISFHWISFECGACFQFSYSCILLFCCFWGCFSSTITLVITSPAAVYIYPGNSYIHKVVLWSVASVTIFILFSLFFCFFVLLLWIRRQLLKCVLHTIYSLSSTVNVDFMWIITIFLLQFFILLTIFLYSHPVNFSLPAVFFLGALYQFQKCL